MFFYITFFNDVIKYVTYILFRFKKPFHFFHLIFPFFLLKVHLTRKLVLLIYLTPLNLFKPRKLTFMFIKWLWCLKDAFSKTYFLVFFFIYPSLFLVFEGMRFKSWTNKSFLLEVLFPTRILLVCFRPPRYFFQLLIAPMIRRGTSDFGDLNANTFLNIDTSYAR